MSARALIIETNFIEADTNLYLCAIAVAQTCNENDVNFRCTRFITIAQRARAYTQEHVCHPIILTNFIFCALNSCDPVLHTHKNAIAVEWTLIHFMRIHN